MSKVYFDLTRRQYEALLPLREKVLNGHGNDEKGAILLQPVPFPGGHGVTAGFVPHKYAKRISDILLELEKEEERKADNERLKEVAKKQAAAQAKIDEANKGIKAAQKTIADEKDQRLQIRRS